ncbi:DedA family protein [Thorsellia kenyensis]|uniref:DedA family protein n=1 Tax=Thorsellia kenyensis TaxID=1549888 RepID=A0ABV6CBT8_9GAMM
MEYILLIVDFILHIDVHLKELISEYGVWVYGILFLIVFCETGLVVTPFLPGDSLLFVAGALASLPESPINVHMIVLLLLVAAILGDAVNYMIGKYFGLRLFSNPDAKWLKPAHLDKTHAFYKKYGGKTIIIARFIPIVRTFAPFVAGMGKMNYTHFALFNVTGAILWVMSFSYAGYFFGQTTFVKENLKILIIAIIFISILPAVIEFIKERRKIKRNQ